ncbi:hypothetical protein PgNI_11274, partial [Pyricularia grisea]|uniref:Aminoglycoside phosphotransferase domain-containing protein n=1 Tax=Pyricularia grisea TaxID=148305 RepID=A0A6P8APE9_PYRGI
MTAQSIRLLVSQLSWGTIDSTPKQHPIDYPALLDYALNVRLSSLQVSSPPFSKCVLLPQLNFGGLHLVRLIKFDDDEIWVVRIQLNGGTQQATQRLVGEVHVLSLVRERTRIPVPSIFAFESTTENPVGVPFFLMEFVPGDTVMDSFGGYEVHRGQIPQHHKPSFVRQVAKLQVEMASVRFPQIGTVIKQHDGSYTIGPLPILGGPFSTAAEYFKAWAQHAKFPKSEAELQRYIPEGLEELKSSILDFPSFLAAAADQIPLLDGPFPLYHPDFRHSNIIVDANCNVLSVIDWENASTVPWEIVQPPLFLSTVPAPMNLPSGYDENCLPIDPEERRSWQD